MSGKKELSNDLKIFIWNKTIDHLQYYTWVSLKLLVRTPITFVLGSFESKIRKAQDWKPVDLDKLNPIILPPQKLLKEGVKVLRANSDAVHVFQGLRGGYGYNYFPLILFALRNGINVIVLDEAYSISPVGYFYDENPLLAHFKTWVRPILRYSMARVLYAVSRSKKPCIMPLSLIAEKQFLKAGFSANTLFPFGYFVPRQQIENKANSPSSTLRLVFVGALIYRKGLDILVKAVQKLHEQGYKVMLDIYGSGEFQKVVLPNLPIYYRGTLPFDQIQAAIVEHDILILPSRHDGWGVVVNEALLQGIPVIVSDRVGAKCLIESDRAGLIFKSEDVEDLVNQLIGCIETPSLLCEMSENAKKISKLILPADAAQYFYNVLNYYFYDIGSRPQALWSNKYD
jgi:glycosyltransferase involved in cell wall biosynthesis